MAARRRCTGGEIGWTPQGGSPTCRISRPIAHRRTCRLCRCLTAMCTPPRWGPIGQTGSGCTKRSGTCGNGVRIGLGGTAMRGHPLPSQPDPQRRMLQPMRGERVDRCVAGRGASDRSSAVAPIAKCIARPIATSPSGSGRCCPPGGRSSPLSPGLGRIPGHYRAAPRRDPVWTQTGIPPSGFAFNTAPRSGRTTATPGGAHRASPSIVTRSMADRFTCTSASTGTSLSHFASWASMNPATTLAQ